MATFTWTPERSSDGFRSYALRLEGEIVGYSAKVPRGAKWMWKACAVLNRTSISFLAGSPRSARRALEHEIDKRSIGLLGDDSVSFTISA